MKSALEIGRVVYSLAGRDKGRFYVVVEIVDDKNVKIADGDFRKIGKAKTKKIMHLKAQEPIFPEIAAKISEGKEVQDAEIRKALKNVN
jgi:Ribosomal protein L14E/L6E/L27E